MQLTFKEGDGCGAVRDRDTTLAAGAKVDSLSSGERHTANFAAAAARCRSSSTAAWSSEAAIDRNRRFGLSLAVPAGEATLDELRLEEPRGNPLFNGKDLSGWFVNNGKGTWAVDNGDIIPTSHRGLHYLRTDKEYANFTFSFEYKISKGGNSGVAIRTAKDGWPSGDGMELQILDQPGEVKDSTMAIYGNLPPLDRADRSEAWNRVIDQSRRPHDLGLGQRRAGATNQYRPPAARSSIAICKGWIGVQDHGGKVRFRELYVHEAPDGLGLDAWYAPHAESGPQIVLDRLMNSERLSRTDGLGSGVVAKSVPKGGEHVLAELTGPGALVRLWSSYAAGRMAFYFDGEEQPRIECGAEHVFDNVPGAAHQEQPTLMCLAYAKSLKIVVSDPLAADYRLDYVTFPAGVPVESFSVKRPGVPRGMLQAISYRHEGLTGGKLREADLLPAHQHRAAHDRARHDRRAGQARGRRASCNGSS